MREKDFDTLKINLEPGTLANSIQKIGHFRLNKFLFQEDIPRTSAATYKLLSPIEPLPCPGVDIYCKALTALYIIGLFVTLP